ncbi:MAG: Nin-like protein, partial [Saprospiraceae bacterium]
MNTFKLNHAAVISFSGGRTSGYMLKQFIEANDGLPNDCLVTFANTGKEEEATLEFVDRCSKEWEVPIIWLEYQWAEKTKDRFKVVDFQTAARNGEPFEALIHAKKYLP